MIDAPIPPMRMGLIILLFGVLGCSADTGSAPTSPLGYETPTFTPSPQIVDEDGDGFSSDADCDDTNGDVNPSAQEVCDGIDNNCDGNLDDETSVDGQLWYPDVDRDGYGAGEATVACSRPGEQVETAGDCNDGDAEINPDALEVCDALQTDENCNGLADDEDPDTSVPSKILAFIDADHDGFGDLNERGAPVCHLSEGTVLDNTDCNDADANINPSATEICDPENVDENCNGLADDDDSTTDSLTYAMFYTDLDRDGYGDSEAETALRCDEGPGASLIAGDCNDNNDGIHPNAPEVCTQDGIDYDCDSAIDCADPDCSEADACQVLDCPFDDLASALGESMLNSSNDGTGNGLEGSCGGDKGQDVSFSWTAPSNATYIFSTEGSEIDTILYLRDGNCDGAELACDDDNGVGFTSELEVELEAGQQIVIVVDGDNKEDKGAFSLSVQVREQEATPTPVSSGCAEVWLGSTMGYPAAEGTLNAASGNELLGSCGLDGFDMAHEFVAPTTGWYSFDTFGSEIVDTTMYILDEDCDGAELGCSQDSFSGQGYYQSRLNLELTQGNTVVIVVEGYGFSEGGYRLNIAGP